MPMLPEKSSSTKFVERKPSPALSPFAKAACQSPLFPTEGSQRPVPQLLRIAFARFGSLDDAFGYDLIN